MGQDKALLLLPNGNSQMKNAAQLLSSVGAEQVLINHNDAPQGTGFIEDYPGRGPVSGIQGALKHSADNPLLILPVDMPLMTADLLQLLVLEAASRQASVYFTEQCLPLLIYQPQQAFNCATELLRSGENPSIWRVLRALEAESIESNYQIAFHNANNPAQWQECLQTLKS
ncbi:molybdenum cofactor guanylyltransferase [Planctobacterium marinum]|uniref:Molybdenum cofactor guanylyltransferase n=2 Tax=Planctobacterium marinum TaxID=1631968 RepID=A0AA48HPJ1_9ALTE|nr:molybdenum cofactor guanylyltransferase [Planctobacterium marinum]